MNIDQLLGNRRYLFWTLQIAGWGGWGVTWYASNASWGDLPDNYHIYIIVISLLGLLISLGMRGIYRASWESHPLRRAIIILVTSWVAAAIWVALRHYIFTNVMEVKGTVKSGANAHGSDLFFAMMEGITTHWFVMLCWSGLYVGIKYYQLLQEERARGIRIESTAHEAQLKMLRYQLNPHFLFNTLNAISTLVLEQSNATANGMISKLSTFLRYSLDSDPMQKVTLNQEVEALNLYLDIEKVRFDERLQVVYDVHQEYQQALIPSLLLQPLVENAIKYAISKSVAGGSIRVGAYRFDTELLLEVADDGPGLSPQAEQPLPGHGVGMANTRNRLQELYGDRQSLTLGDNAPHGLVVSIRIPFETGDKC